MSAASGLGWRDQSQGQIAGDRDQFLAPELLLFRSDGKHKMLWHSSAQVCGGE